jgi:hypothetical protein
MSSHHNSEEKLNELFAAYRQEMADFEGGADFLPGMWSKIDRKKAQTSAWLSWTRTILAGATCAGALLVGFSVWSPFDRSAYYESSYVEALDDSEDFVVMAALHPASPVDPPTE